MKERWYLAGPFFNPSQVALMESIEREFASAQVDFFSPRLADPLPPGPVKQEMAMKIFKRNLNELQYRCDNVLAVVDWLLPPEEEIRSLRVVSTVLNNQRVVEFTSKPLNIPDSGTVWEMGVAYVEQLNIYVYMSDTNRRLNVMLSQCADGIVKGIEDLFQVLRGKVPERLTGDSQ